jgi:hypothetical protein
MNLVEYVETLCRKEREKQSNHTREKIKIDFFQTENKKRGAAKNTIVHVLAATIVDIPNNTLQQIKLCVGLLLHNDTVTYRPN